LLVVEDDPQFAAALVRMLESIQPWATIRRAADGMDAGLLLATMIPAVAIVDIGLPTIDGVELIRRARREPKLDSVRFIVVSGQAEERAAELCQLGVEHILPKPCTLLQLRAALDALLALPAAPSTETPPATTSRKAHA
jgi:CheY-like chemotaxis protein